MAASPAGSPGLCPPCCGGRTTHLSALGPSSYQPGWPSGTPTSDPQGSRALRGPAGQRTSECQQQQSPTGTLTLTPGPELTVSRPETPRPKETARKPPAYFRAYRPPRNCTPRGQQLWLTPALAWAHGAQPDLGPHGLPLNLHLGAPARLSGGHVPLESCAGRTLTFELTGDRMTGPSPSPEQCASQVPAAPRGGLCPPAERRTPAGGPFAGQPHHRPRLCPL